jgi:hypothetical protein
LSNRVGTGRGASAAGRLCLIGRIASHGLWNLSAVPIPCQRPIDIPARAFRVGRRNR